MANGCRETGVADPFERCVAAGVGPFPGGLLSEHFGLAAPFVARAQAPKTIGWLSFGSAAEGAALLAAFWRGMNERGNMIFELVPLNDDFPSLRSDVNDIHIVGTMIEHRKYRRR